MANKPVIPDTFKLLALGDEITDRLTGATCDLYTNNQTPTHSSVIGDFIIAAWGGYAQQSLSGWTSPTLDGSFRAFTTADPVQFPNSSGAAQTAYGFLYRDSGGNLIAACLYVTPIVVPDGLFLQETVEHTYQSEF